MNTSDSAVTIAVVGVLATCVGGLLWIIKFMFMKIVPSIDGLTKATAANTAATKSADKYLRERNGRDNEAHTETLLAIQEVPKTMRKIASEQALDSKDQHIEHQEVATQIVKEKK